MSSKAVTFGDVIREYFPGISDEETECIIWSETGYPCFWNIPEDGATPIECFRKQLEDYRREINGRKMAT